MMMKSEWIEMKMRSVLAARSRVEEAETKSGYRLLDKALWSQHEAREALLLELAGAMVLLLKEREGAQKPEPDVVCQPTSMDAVAMRLLGREKPGSCAGSAEEKQHPEIGTFTFPRD